MAKDLLSLMGIVEQETQQELQLPQEESRGVGSKWVDLLVWALAGPIVGDPSWLATLPDWLKQVLPIDRMACILEQLKEGKDIDSFEASDVDVVITLYSYSLTAPMHSEYANIYLYQSAKVMRKYRKDSNLEEKIKSVGPPEKLNDYELSELSNIKRHIFRASFRAMKEKHKKQRRAADEKLTA